jgi:tetratricopeptide repeat protein 21B
MKGSFTEAIRDFQVFVDKRDWQLSALLMMEEAHKSCTHIDTEAVEELKARITIACSSSLSDRSLLNTSYVLYYLSRFEEAREYANKLLESNNNSSQGKCALGWIDLESIPNISYFDAVLDKAPRDLDALMGKLQVRFSSLIKRY